MIPLAVLYLPRHVPFFSALVLNDSNVLQSRGGLYGTSGCPIYTSKTDTAFHSKTKATFDVHKKQTPYYRVIFLDANLHHRETSSTENTKESPIDTYYDSSSYAASNRRIDSQTLTLRLHHQEITSGDRG
jgi:hypothetical protein